MQSIIFGIITGSILAIATVGLSMIRQTEGFINIAHGQFLTLGAFVGFFFVSEVELNIFVAGLLATIIVGAVGVAVSRIVFRPIASSGPLAQLFTSIGLAYLMFGLIRVGFGASVKFFPTSFGTRFEAGSVNVTMGELLIVAVAGLSVAALALFLTRTKLGTWIRATASNPSLAEVRGVPVSRVSAAVWFVASGLAGLAGVMVGLIGNVNSEMGWHQILIILAAAVLGGLGSIYGVLAAGLLLGLAMDLSALVVPTAYRTVVAFGVLILVLLLRPEGLFSVAGRKEAG
ncbi:MAG: branched-chain amino acid ABC transporter permease [Acidimicrobiia bacterium]|nr:branched-chain amino acid ABC transporter permease [Acidimicrobiia bacterium]